MTPREFIQKWSASSLKERSGSQEHFIDLCRMLGQPTPADVDPTGETYTFEKGAAIYGGGDGWADVWKKGYFAWEYKGKHKDLGAAYGQLLRYRESLENPPLLVVSDMERFEIHTNFTGTAKTVHAFSLGELTQEKNRKVLEALFTDPESLRPGTRIEEVTEHAAKEFASLAESLRSRGVEPRKAAHFLNRILFCLFAEDVGLLPSKLFQRLIEAGARSPEELTTMFQGLFHAMTHGGLFGVEKIHHFNGGLFGDGEVVPLALPEIGILRRAAALNWSQIEPAIFGTLFERGLDPSKRSQLGAHYTDRGAILRVVEPVLMAPLRREWAEVRKPVEDLLKKTIAATKASADARYRKEARTLIREFRKERLDKIRVLDPACGSGNFLYVALELLHEFEKEILLLLAEVDQGQFSLDIRVGPHQVQGIEINSFAQELAQVTIWIGHLQWHLKNGFNFDKEPVLSPIQSIECRDAILDLSDPKHPKEAQWPEAEVVVGNPPFLGDKKMLAELGDTYVLALRQVFEGRLPGGTDLVTYWFEKARAEIQKGRLKRAGLLATNSIRGGRNRRVLERIREFGRIFMSWSDEPWVVEGAAVRISLIGFDGMKEVGGILDGHPVAEIYADLTGADAGSSRDVDLTRARRLADNLKVAFQGPVKVGPFDVPGDLARAWLSLPSNPNGAANWEVVQPWANGMDITRRPSDKWIIDFGVETPESEAALYEAPFEYVKAHVKPVRDQNRDEWRRTNWWLHGRSGEDLRTALRPLRRYIATPRVAKHRLFVWLDVNVLPDSAVVAIARDDDTTLGILHSRFHEAWALRMCTWLGVGNDPRYTPTTTFETFPFPDGLSAGFSRGEPSEQPHYQVIAERACTLIQLRDAWLNPPELVRRVGEVVPGYPDRIVPVNEIAAADLKERTLTKLYNLRPSWLANAHAALDDAVAAAYGWGVDISEDEVLARLLALNLEREPA